MKSDNSVSTSASTESIDEEWANTPPTIVHDHTGKIESSGSASKAEHSNSKHIEDAYLDGETDVRIEANAEPYPEGDTNVQEQQFDTNEQMDSMEDPEEEVISKIIYGEIKQLIIEQEESELEEEFENETISRLIASEQSQAANIQSEAPAPIAPQFDNLVESESFVSERTSDVPIGGKQQLHSLHYLVYFVSLSALVFSLTTNWHIYFNLEELKRENSELNLEKEESQAALTRLSSTKDKDVATISSNQLIESNPSTDSLEQDNNTKEALEHLKEIEDLTKQLENTSQEMDKLINGATGSRAHSRRVWRTLRSLVQKKARLIRKIENLMEKYPGNVRALAEEDGISKNLLALVQ